ncbi:hypothetical protein EYF80_046620 [Liparis tanakae]|uniref:Uncharacterized protein n=1 Tax=Liparis tanakae TaxID=230148 RepID=A0A4Z2FPY6_9TELE|nr:hypothetical protein EYF80_046620 [Liparis tanakae]
MHSLMDNKVELQKKFCLRDVNGEMQFGSNGIITGPRGRCNPPACPWLISGSPQSQPCPEKTLHGDQETAESSPPPIGPSLFQKNNGSGFQPFYLNHNKSAV